MTSEEKQIIKRIIAAVLNDSRSSKDYLLELLKMPSNIFVLNISYQGELDGNFIRFNKENIYDENEELESNHNLSVYFNTNEINDILKKYEVLFLDFEFDDYVNIKINISFIPNPNLSTNYNYNDLGIDTLINFK